MTYKPFRPEDVLKLKTLGQIQLSPDGALLAYELKENDLESDTVKTNIWWAATDTAADGEAKPRQITFSGKDSSPSWSHDGQTLAFVSSRSGKPQIYLLDRQGGEARLVATDCTPGGRLLWSADDLYLAFLAPVEIHLEGERYPGEPAELWQAAAEELSERRKKGAPEQKDKGGKGEAKTPPVHVVTRFDYRNDGVGLSYESYRQLFVLDLREGSCRQLSFGEERIRDFAWLNDAEFVFTIDRLGKDFLNQSSMRIIAIAEGSQDRELLLFPGSISSLRVSAKGELLFTATRSSLPMGVAPSEIFVWRESERRAESLTESFDRSCHAAEWSSDGSALTYLKETEARLVLCRLGYANGVAGEEEILPLHGTGSISQYSRSANDALAFCRSDIDLLPQLYLRTAQGAKQLTFIDAEYAVEGAFLPAETIRFKGPEAWDVEGFVIRPRDFTEGQPVPTVVIVHGGPTSAFMHSFTPYFQMLASNGFGLVFINPRGSTSYGTNFTRGVIADWGGGDFGDIMAGLDKAIEMKIADPDKLGMMGWSYGGYMTCWGVTQTDRFKAAIGGANISSIYNLYFNSDIGALYDEALMGGMAFDLEELYMSRSAIRHVRKVTTPILLLHGEADIRCPIDQSEMFYTALKRLGKEVAFVRYPEQYHGLTRPSYVLDRWERTLSWFKHHLG